MHSIGHEEKLINSGEYAIITENDQYFLINKKTDGRVEVDKLGKIILDLLPASFNEIKEKLFKTYQLLVPEKMLQFYLLLFRKSGICIDETKHPVTQNNASIKSNTKTSIMIVTYNGEKFIKQNMDSILQQSKKPDEIIIVDNNSTDKTINILQQYKSNIRIIRNKKNYHYAKAVNIGLNSSQNELIIVLNQDIILDKNFIKNLADKYDSYKNKEEIAGLVPQIRFTRLNGFINSIGNFFTRVGWGSDNYFGVIDIGQIKEIKTAKSACFGAVVITRQGLEKVGPLDNKYKSYYEDVDWSFRAHLKDMKLLIASDAIVYHAFGGSYNASTRTRFVVKNRLRLILKNFSGRIMLGFAKNYMKEDTKNILIFMKNRQFKIVILYFLAYFDLSLQVFGLIYHHLKKRSASKKQIEDFFIENKVVLANTKNEPVISAEVIRSYYYSIL